MSYIFETNRIAWIVRFCCVRKDKKKERETGIFRAWERGGNPAESINFTES